ncbi:hypothetical protein B0H10DRAFT_1960322 [Mycena sp. CBHHK59/15]|nr:hypothetical protein B0H10DRAFT_1960322 [Mycena sp. CBHHK59/15]
MSSSRGVPYLVPQIKGPQMVSQLAKGCRGGTICPYVLSVEGFSVSHCPGWKLALTSSGLCLVKLMDVPPWSSRHARSAPISLSGEGLGWGFEPPAEPWGPCETTWSRVQRGLASALVPGHPKKENVSSTSDDIIGVRAECGKGDSKPFWRQRGDTRSRIMIHNQNTQFSVSSHFLLGVGVSVPELPGYGSAALNNSVMPCWKIVSQSGPLIASKPTILIMIDKMHDKIADQTSDKAV